MDGDDSSNNMSTADLPRALQLLDEMNENVKQVSDVVGNVLAKVKQGDTSTEFGLNFLEVKYHMLLNYLINLTQVVLRKCSGEISLRSANCTIITTNDCCFRPEN